MAWATQVNSALLTVGNNFEAFTDGTNALVIETNPRELVDINVNIASLVGEVDDLEVQVLAGQRLSTGLGLAGAASATSVTLNAADDNGDDYWMGQYFLMTSGGEVADLRQISDFVASTDIATLERALSGTPTTAETYNIYQMRPVHQFVITAETVPTEDLPQNAGVTVVGYQFIIVRARRTGTTDAHVALMTYTKDGVNA